MRLYDDGPELPSFFDQDRVFNLIQLVMEVRTSNLSMGLPEPTVEYIIQGMEEAAKGKLNWKRDYVPHLENLKLVIQHILNKPIPRSVVTVLRVGDN